MSNSATSQSAGPPAQASRPPQAAEKWLRLSPEALAGRIRRIRRRTLALVDDLTDAQWDGTPSDIANPVRWEVGHVANFYERFLLYELGHTAPLIENGYALYNSFVLDRDDRWDVPLPSRRGTLEYMRHVTWYVLEWLDANDPDPWETYLYLTAVLHEEMHSEALTWYRQTQGFAAPPPDADARPQAAPPCAVREAGPPLRGDAEVPGGTFSCGATPERPYVWDNEKWAHPVDLPAYRISRTAVTQAEFAAFVNDGGYGREALWGYEGWRWLQREGITQPLYWQREAGGWLRRHYDRWVPLAADEPMVHVNWFEASAYCRWANRRLPTEPEWELAAAGTPAGTDADGKRSYPWGERPPGADSANLDGGAAGCVDVSAHPLGDSAWGCRQMLGNVWEWTESPFYPYAGYTVDYPYREYSAPWFGNHRVLRGGSWATRSTLISNTFRNYFRPHRRDIIAGFRTCAL